MPARPRLHSEVPGPSPLSEIGTASGSLRDSFACLTGRAFPLLEAGVATKMARMISTVLLAVAVLGVASSSSLGEWTQSNKQYPKDFLHGCSA